VTYSVDEILERLRGMRDPVNVAGMARFGIRPALVYGVPMPAIRSLAKEVGRNHALALSLWRTGVHEARVLAALIADAKQFTEDEAEEWARGFDSWAVCDSACLAVLWKTPFSWRKVREWSRRKPEFERRAAFALLAALAVHDKKASDKQFEAALRIIARAANDERNFVKKAVNWALRQVGKRSAALHGPALKTAEQLAASESRAARWIGLDALRELRSAAVAERLRTKARRGSEAVAAAAHPPPKLILLRKRLASVSLDASGSRESRPP
jgi:3-methyladenine DNA glycosylase AlkD